MSGKFVWFEYVSKDINKAQGFFGELFNWGVQKVPMPQGDYAMISAGERTIGGFAQPALGQREKDRLTHVRLVEVGHFPREPQVVDGIAPDIRDRHWRPFHRSRP